MRQKTNEKGQWAGWELFFAARLCEHPVGLSLAFCLRFDRFAHCFPLVLVYSSRIPISNVCLLQISQYSVIRSEGCETNLW
jgi:hypothetical protein